MAIDGMSAMVSFAEYPELFNEKYNVYGGRITSVGEMQILPAHISSDVFVLPLDSNNMYLEDYNSLTQGAEYYNIGADCLPVKKY